MAEFDLSTYVRAPIMDVPTGVALGVSLISALPKDAPPAVKASAKKLRASLVALQAAWGVAAAPAPPVNRRAADSAADISWGCLEDRLSAYSRLPVSEYPNAARAAEIHLTLFPAGLDFLTLPYKAQWAEAERRLKLIADKGYENDIDLLAGPEFLAEIKRTHTIYGKALGVTHAEDLPAEIRLLEPLRELGQAVVDYSLQLLAYASAEPKRAAAVRKALKPIDDHRADSARRASAGGVQAEEPEASPKTPVPEVPE
jgi:hypothetical protein